MKNCDILGLGVFDSCEIRIHPTGSAIARLGTISQGQGHATTFVQILATEIGLPADSITIEEGDTDTAPYGLGTYRSRSTPVAGAATAMAGRKIRAYVDYPARATELAILRTRCARIEDRLARQVIGFVQALRKEELEKVPGIAETLDFAAALMGPGIADLTSDPAPCRPASPHC